jgi:hypothetical protein
LHSSNCKSELARENLKSNAFFQEARAILNDLREQARSYIKRSLYLAKQQQNQQNYQDGAENTRRAITPVARVGEYWQTTDQQEDQNNDKNEAHILFSLLVF